MKNNRYIEVRTFAILLKIGLFLISLEAYSHNLLREKIRKIASRKMSVYFEEGTFHKGDGDSQATLNAIRHSFYDKAGHERLVFDFQGSNTPNIYGHISQKERKLYIDMSHTTVNPSVSSFGNSQFVKNLFFYPIDKESLSMEIELKSPGKFDIFYLSNPGRLVVDIKN